MQGNKSLLFKQLHVRYYFYIYIYKPKQIKTVFISDLGNLTCCLIDVYQFHTKTALLVRS